MFTGILWRFRKCLKITIWKKPWWYSLCKQKRFCYSDIKLVLIGVCGFWVCEFTCRPTWTRHPSVRTWGAFAGVGRRAQSSDRRISARRLVRSCSALQAPLPEWASVLQSLVSSRFSHVCVFGSDSAVWNGPRVQCWSPSGVAKSWHVLRRRRVC